MLKSKIHRATVTHADVAYEGSVSIDAALLEAANVLSFEAVHVWNVTNGSRLMTYAIPAQRNSGIVCINGAAARLNKPGDIVILATFAEMEPSEAKSYQPMVVQVDESNRVLDASLVETPGPARAERPPALNAGRNRPIPVN